MNHFQDVKDILQTTRTPMDSSVHSQKAPLSTKDSEQGGEASNQMWKADREDDVSSSSWGDTYMMEQAVRNDDNVQSGANIFIAQKEKIIPQHLNNYQPDEDVNCYTPTTSQKATPNGCDDGSGRCRIIS